MSIEFNDSDWGFDASYRRPPARESRLKPGLSLKLSFFPDVPLETMPGAASHSNPDGEWHISEDINLWLHADSPQSFWYFHNALRALQLFFTVAARRLTLLTETRLTGAFETDHLPNGRHPHAKLYFDLPLADQWDEPPHPREFLFREDDAGERMGLMLRNWFRKFKKLEPALLLYNISCYSSLFRETQFLTFCQAIESYHRGLRGGRYMPEAEFDEGVLRPILAALPSASVPALRASIRDRVRFANDYSLRTRLKQLVALHERALVVRVEDPLRLANEAVDARNAFTHPTSWPPKGVDYTRLPLLARFLRLLLELSFLKEMGFRKNELHTLCARNRMYTMEFGTRRAT